VPSFVTVRLQDVTSATPRSCLLSLDVSRLGFEFHPGQAVVIGEHTQTIRRPYSIASSPEQARERGTLELLVGLDAAGSPGPHLASMRPGSAIDLEGPVGAFTFPETLAQRRLLFVAGGTGIAPLRSMIDHVLRAHPAEQVALLYSARRADEFAFIEELRGHARNGRLELHQTVTRDDDGWAGGRGRIGRAHFEAVLHEPVETLCFVCGPSAMVTEAVATLAQLGVPIEAIRTEQWSTKS
jgi:ring-1,2-phenylacetyl-CoA epoxidase subunit PaaE